MGQVNTNFDAREALEARYAAAYLTGFHRHSDKDIKDRVEKVNSFFETLTDKLDEDVVFGFKEPQTDNEYGEEVTYELTMTIRVKVIATSKMEAAERAESTAFWQDWETLTFPYDIERVT